MAPGNDRAPVVSGADLGDAARRRNVPGAPQHLAVPQPQQPQQPQQQADDKKKKPKPAPSVLSILDQWEWVIAPIVFTALAFFTRFYKIGLSPIVTWDEAQCVHPAPSRRCADSADTHLPQFWKVRQPLPEARILLRRACKSSPLAHNPPMSPN